MIDTAHTEPCLIAVAPNGARLGKHDHPAIPLDAQDLARCAAACCQAGAAMLHLHVRDTRGRHSLDAATYRAAINAVEAVTGDRMLIQISTEAAGIYDVSGQMSAITALAPDYISLALREIAPDEASLPAAARFLAQLHGRGCAVQYILYSPDEVRRYRELGERGVIPDTENCVLFVVGHPRETVPAAVERYLEPLPPRTPWMVCAFGANEQTVVQRAIELGGHIRVGFENNLRRPDGRLLRDNHESVSLAIASAHARGRPIANAMYARQFHRPGALIQTD